MKTIRTHALTLVPLLAIAAFAGVSRAQGMGAHYNTMGESVGLSGYDPVSYFPDGGSRPQKGSIKISTQADGVTYRFVSQANLETFKKSPDRFLPAYGGWCAWAVAELGKRVDVDPLSYEIRGGRLFVFYRDGGLDTRALWAPKADALVAKADARWPALSGGRRR